LSLSEKYKKDLLQLLRQIKDINLDLHISGLEGVSSKALINLAEILEKNESSNQASENSSSESLKSDSEDLSTELRPQKYDRLGRGTLNQDLINFINENESLLRKWLKDTFHTPRELHELCQDLRIEFHELDYQGIHKAIHLARRITQRNEVNKLYYCLRDNYTELAEKFEEYFEKKHFQNKQMNEKKYNPTNSSRRFPHRRSGE
jgi:hypothetical protein